MYPAIEAYKTEMLPVSDVHTLYIEESGNANGKPVICIHGGPGGGSSPKIRQFFDPQKYRIIQFDQRGCGQSTPHADLTDNTTPHMIADIETIREHLGIEKWQVWGGSWGSTLGLAYSEAHPERVTELVLRGIFMCREKELKWFYQEGASRIFPDAFEPYQKFIPQSEQDNMIKAYYQKLTHEDEKTRLQAAKLWTGWEMATCRLLQDEAVIDKAEDDLFSLAFARIECHYFVHNAFLEAEQILKNTHRIKQIPCTIVQGRYDVVCPTTSAWELHKALPQSTLHIVADAGHSCFEEGIAKKLVETTDYYCSMG
jgi:proline iminopeptidase